MNELYSLKHKRLTLEYNIVENDPQMIDQFEEYYLEVRSALKDIFYPLTIIYSLLKT